MLLERLVDAVPAVKGPRGRPGRPRKRPAKLHGDKGYDYPRCRRALRRRGITPRIARRGIESSQRLGRHRYVVERSLAWLVGYRRLQVRYERRADILLGFVHLACALICLKSLDGPKLRQVLRRPARTGGGRRYFGNPTLKTLASRNPERRSRSTCAFACSTVGN